MLVGRLNPRIPSGKACSKVVLWANREILSWSGPLSLKLMTLISCPTSGVPFPFEKPKSPSSEYSAAPRCTGPTAKEFGTKSIPVNEESAASVASGAVIGCGGRASTLRIGTCSPGIGGEANGLPTILWRLAGVQPLGGLGDAGGAGTQRSSPGPPIGLNTAWL